MATDIVLDIETVGPELLDRETRDYLALRMQQQMRRDGHDVDLLTAEDEAKERYGLELGLQRVVAIGMLNLNTDQDHVLCDGYESGMLADFWDTIAKFGRSRIVTFNGRAFDGPVLMIRSAQYGIACTRDLVDYRYDLASHCDLADVLQWQGSVRNFYSLDYWCRRFEIESPKAAGITGADVAQLHSDGDWDSIAEYVRRDVRATGELYKKLRASFLYTFKGGPEIPKVMEPAA